MCECEVLGVGRFWEKGLGGGHEEGEELGLGGAWERMGCCRGASNTPASGCRGVVTRAVHPHGMLL